MSMTPEERLQRACERGRAKLNTERLDELRGDMSWAEVEAASGIERTTLWRLRKGENTPRVATVKALAKAVGGEPLELMLPCAEDELAELKAKIGALV